MKTLLRICVRKKAMILLALILAISGGLFALEPPTKQQLAKYRLDGTLAQRIADAKALGNDRVNPGLIREFQIRLERLRLKALGMSDAEIDDILPVFPPGAGKPGLRNKGNNKVFVLLIDFPDYPSSDTAAEIDGKIFGDGDGDYPFESLRNYYRRSSYGQLEILGSTLGWYRPAYRRADVPQTNEGRENLIKEALNYFDGQGHDFSQYDNDNNGVIDYFLVVWTGPPGAWASFWCGYYVSWGSSFTLDGKQFSGATYSWQWESSPYPGTFRPSVTVHETGHALGLPDLYDYDDTVGPRGGVGGLDMMAGNWGDHNGFSKMLLDWLTPQVCSLRSRTYVLRPTGSHQDAVIFWLNYNIASPFTEFFMVQNRYRVNNDTGLPADGLLIWHVDATLDAWNYYFLYNNSDTAHKLVRLMEADGLEQIERNLGADAGDYYVPGKTFNKNSVPNSNAYDGSLTNAYLDSIMSAGVDMSCNISFGEKTLQIAVNNTSLGTTSPVPGTYKYDTGSQVQVTAIPNTNYEFVNWSGDISNTQNPVTVTMDGNKTIKANFRLKPKLTIQSSQYGTTNPSPGVYYYATGTRVQVSAIPDTYSIFISWSGSATGSANPLSLTMDSDKSIFANFRFIYAPIATGRKVLNRTFSQAEYINILSWQANPANDGLDITKYRIYQMIGTTPSLLVELAASQFEYYHRKAGQASIQYAIVAVTSSNREGAPALVTVQ